MQPNIILLVIDSLRFDHVGFGNHAPSLTPVLDRIAEQGYSFTQAITQGPYTRAAMSSLMSSTYASMYGGEKRLSLDRPVIQEMLRPAGYSTLGVSTNLYLSTPFGWSRGFDYFNDCRPEDVYRKNYKLRVMSKMYKRFGRTIGWPKSMSAEYAFGSAVNHLGRTQPPFFMWIHLMDAHWPYSHQRFSWDEDWLGNQAYDQKILHRLLSDEPEFSSEEFEEIYSGYKTAVRYVDGQLEDFIGRLQRLCLLDNTWLFITADHGEEFFEHGRFLHTGIPYDNLIRVPLIIRPADNHELSKNKIFNNQVGLMDLVPTFLDLAGSGVPHNVNLYGTSLLPFFEGRPESVTREIITESPSRSMYAVRKDGWKLIWDIDNDIQMLFNLVDDPDEQDNLINVHFPIADNLKTILDKHWKNTAPSSAEQEEGAIDQMLIDRLRELGYVE